MAAKKFGDDEPAGRCSSRVRIPGGLHAAAARSGSAAYAANEFGGFKGGLAVEPQYRAYLTASSRPPLAGVMMNFLHVDAIEALFLTAGINGIVASPPLMTPIVLLGSDREVSDEQVSGWLKRHDLGCHGTDVDRRPNPALLRPAGTPPSPRRFPARRGSSRR
jgi:hypothetical protein